MKSLFTKFRAGAQSPPPSTRPSSSSSAAKDKENVASGSSRPLPPKRSNSTFKGKSISRPFESPSPALLPLRSSTPLNPPQTHFPASASTSASTSSEPTRPQSLSVNEPLAIDLAPVIGLWPEERPRTVSAPGGEGGHAGAGKKVTFRSPVPTPTTSVVLDQAIELDPEQGRVNDVARGRASSKTSDGRTVSTSPDKRNAKHASLSSRPPTSQSTTSSRPRPTSRQSSPFLPSLAARPPALRKSSMPPLSKPTSLTSPVFSYDRMNSPSRGSVLTPTPSEASLGGTSARSYLPPPNSWSEMAEPDLIANLSPKERTRQEVLWEIVSSEERYVQELIKLNETFCRNLLPPSAQSPHLDLFDHSATLSRTFSPTLPLSPALSSDSVINLPIAARYASPGLFSHGDSRIPSDSSTSTAGPVTPNEDAVAQGVGATLFVPPPSAAARMNAYNILTNGRPSEPNRKSSFSSLIHGRSHHSMPPVPRRANSSAQETRPSMPGLHTRLSYQPGMAPNKLQKPHDRVTSGSSITSRDVNLPEELEKVLMVLSGGILEGHIKLAAALKRRYENQYPLVRTLADVFTAHSYVLREYNTYVLNLERALGQVDDALTLFTDTHPHPHNGPKQSKRNSRRLEDTDQGKLGRLLLSLEELAAERGESGLVISLSKPFQRLLKYPLLFQNLLFNTDPSLREYEATLAMVDEVEFIVRQIEDEKSSAEQREKTRDVWARIDGLEKDKMLIAPKPNRMLISESQLPQPAGVEVKVKTDVTSGAVKQKKSFKRLSDILKSGHEENSDLWVVRFSDVSLLCERTGATQLPVSSLHKMSKSESSDSAGKFKYATAGKRASSVHPRNLYRFVKVYEWHLRPKTGSTEALLKMDDISRARQVSATAPRLSKEMRSTLTSIPGTPHGTPTKVPVKTGDGSTNASPTKTPKARRGSDTDTIASDRMSVMSFAFKGSDQVMPVTHKPKPSPLANGRITPKSPRKAGELQPGGGTLQRRVSGGHVAGSAANAKFANRLRTADDSTGGDIPRAASRARRSLPPAMIMQRSHNANISGSTPPSSVQNRPAWNSGLSARAPSATGSVRVAGTRTPSSVGARRERVASAGVKAPTSPRPTTTTPGTAQSGKATMKKVPSEDSSLAGLWKEYGSFDIPSSAIGSTPSTPVKSNISSRPAPPGSVGGRGRGAVAGAGAGRGAATPVKSRLDRSEASVAGSRRDLGGRI